MSRTLEEVARLNASDPLAAHGGHLDYPTEAIPPGERCDDCAGNGETWEATGHDEAGVPTFEPVATCSSCRGTGVRPHSEWEPPSFLPIASALELEEWRVDH